MNINADFKTIIPDLTTEEYNILESDIVKNGCLDSIKLWNNYIIDGHNRYKICTENNISFDTENIEFNVIEDVKLWIINNQLGRRNLTPYQRGVLALKQKEIIAAKAKEQQGKRTDLLANLPKSESINTRKELSKISGVKERTLDKIEFIEKNASPEVKEKLNDSELSIHKAYSEVIREIQKEKREEKIFKAVEFPKGKYKTIVIDPPWNMQKLEREVRPNQISEFDYPIMTIEEIKNLPIGQLSDKRGCHLYLWTTQKWLYEARELLNIWGFQYHFLMVWHKNGGFQPYNLPQYNCEFILFGRTNGMLFITTKDFPMCFNGDRKEHSVKPDRFFDIVSRVSPEPRLEMFARKSRDGFMVWGNEI